MSHLSRSTPNVDPRSTRENPDRQARTGGGGGRDAALGGVLRNREGKDEEEEEEGEETTRGEISQIYDSGIFLFVLIADSARRKSIFQRRVVVNWRSFREESDTAKSNWLSRSHRRAQFVTHAKAN